MLEGLRRALTEDGAERRVRIATAMALVAMLGAVTTFRASDNELVASSCARRHAEAEAYFVYRKQWYADMVGENAQYSDEYKLHRSRAQRYLHASLLDLPQGAPDRAFFQIEAQIEYAVARQVQPLKAFTDTALDYNLGLGPGLDKKADDDLRSIGFGTGCVPGAKHTATLSALNKIATDTGNVRMHSIRCAAAVVIFVLALVFFTLSEAVPQRLKRIFEALGYITSVGAIATGIFWADRALAVQYLLAIAAFAIIAAIGWSVLRGLQRRSPPSPAPAADAEGEQEVLRVEEFDTEGFRAKHVHFVTPHDRFSRVVVVLIAVAALLSAVAGLSYSVLIARSERAAMIAATHETNIDSEYAHEALVLRYVIRQQSVGTEADLRENALQLLQLGKLPGYANADVAPWAYERVQWMHAFGDLAPAGSSMDHTYLEYDDGPYLDARFPAALYYSRVAIAPAREVALADAFDEDAAIYERGATYCLFMLTVFAIALYLFGQALAMGTSNGARILAFFAGVLILIGVGAAVRTIQITRTSNGAPAAFSAACPRPTSSPAPPATRAEVAASCYAQGVYSDEIANDREEYAPAVQHFRDTVQLRPQFALSQYQMLDAEGELATPQRTGYESIEDPQLVPRMIADRKAVAETLNERDMGTPLGFIDSSAFDSYIDSLLTHDRRMLQSSLKQAQSDPEAAGDSQSQYNVGVMMLADGRFSDAVKQYNTAVTLKPKDEEADISAISDMELLRAQCPRLPWQTGTSCAQLAQTEDGIKSRLVQGTFSTPAPDPPSPQLHIGAWVAPDGVSWAAPAEQLKRFHGKFAVLWYLRDPTWHSWYVHLGLMHHTDTASMQRVGSVLLDYNSYLAVSDFVRCLPTRQDFRVEVYSGGRLIAQKTIPGRPNDPPFVGGQFGVADVGFCYPQSPQPSAQWTRRIDVHGDLDGSYIDPSGAFAVRTFDLYAPKQPDQRATDLLGLRYLYSFLFDVNSKYKLQPAPLDCPPATNPLHAMQIRALTNGTVVLGQTWASADGLLRFLVVRHRLPPGVSVLQPDTAGCQILASAQTIYPDEYTSK